MDINQNLGNLMKEAQKMQQRMQDAQKQLAELVVVGEAGGGKVTTKITGKHRTLEFVIHPSLADDVEMLQDLCTAAANDAATKLEKISQQKISELTAGLNIPTDLMGGQGDTA